MKIAHSLGWYFPDSCGGTEVYVDSLVQELSALGFESRIVAPRDGTEDDRYPHRGVSVYRYPMNLSLSAAQMRGIVPRGGFEKFADWLEKERVDLYHQHSWTAGCGLYNLRWAKKLGLPTVMTMHLPGSICLRGTMIHNGETVCDGKIDPKRCVSCWARRAGAPPWMATAISHVPAALSRQLNAMLPPSRLTTLTAMPSLTEAHRDHFLEMVDLSDRVVIPCQWMYDAFLLNGIKPQKLMLCRQGVSLEPIPRGPISADARSPLRIGFLGRFSPLKGINILVEAVKRLPPQIPVELAIYGVASDTEERQVRRMIMESLSHETRVHVKDPVAHEELAGVLRTFDLLAIPSKTLETGPLVALEAFSAGVPVMGSNIGGVAELVSHGVDGWLLPSRDVSAWASALRYFSEHRDVVERLRSGIHPVKTMKTVAKEMAALYREVGRK
jgi:glycosyltransferase involved in cell wall biosynthesis